MRSDSDRPTKLVVIATLTALVAALVALGALSAVGAVAETPSATADADPAFAVEITDYDAAVTEGDALVVEATVTNEGPTADSQQIHLKNERNEIVDSVADPPLTLGPNESAAVTLAWDTGPGDAGTEDVKVVSDHGSDERTVRIGEGSFFTVESVETDSPVTAGDDLTATVTVTNDDPNATTRDVWIEVDGDRVAETAVELSPGETRNERLTWTETADGAGNWTLAAATTGDRLTTGVTVTESESTESGSDSGDSTDAPDNSTDAPDNSTDAPDNSTDAPDNSTDSPDSSTDEDDDESGSGWSIPSYVEKRDNGVVDGDGVVALPGNEVAVVEFERETVSGLVVVDRLRGLPEGVTAPDEPVGTYRIDPDREFADENATVTFAYSNETLNESVLDRVEVVRWNGTTWTALDAEATSHGDEVTVEAETRGFSLFAVTTGGEPDATAGAEAPGNETAAGETTAGENASSTANETADSDDSDTETTDGDSDDSDADDSGSETTDSENADSADEDSTATDSENESAGDAAANTTESSEDESPGFGVVAALLALAAAAGVAARGRRRD